MILNRVPQVGDYGTAQSLHNKRVLSIDLSAIMAGSGIRGQFEEKFKALIRDIEDEVVYLGTSL
jgi:ATP-dependent Clp protease ATP-binding subunit ClpA